jgi:hypothetical protein
VIKPLFIFSAPRSGSTFTQRVLAAHSKVSTASEPWLLLPLLSPIVPGLPASGSRDALIAEALEDFIEALPNRHDSYRGAIRRAAEDLYEAAADPDAEVFIDKTPLYHLIVDEIVASFPDAAFVFLFRNPLSVVASTVELFDQGRWEVHRYEMALFRSISDLVPAARRHGSRAINMRYEDLVGGGEHHWRRLVEHVGLEWEPTLLERFSDVELRGRKGDPTGTRLYSSVSTEPLQKWRKTINTPVRRAWCRRYLRWIGRGRLATMGYDLDALEAELDTLDVRGTGAWTDGVRLVTAATRESIKARVPAHSGGPSVSRRLLAGSNEV